MQSACLTGQSTPSLDPVSEGRSALMPRAPTATWVGIPKDIGCREGLRDFLDFLNNGILVGIE